MRVKIKNISASPLQEGLITGEYIYVENGAIATVPAAVATKWIEQGKAEEFRKQEQVKKGKKEDHADTNDTVSDS